MKKTTNILTAFATAVALILGASAFVSCSSGDDDDAPVVSVYDQVESLLEEFDLYNNTTDNDTDYDAVLTAASTAIDALMDQCKDKENPTDTELKALKLALEKHLSEIEKEYKNLTDDQKKEARPDLFKQ